MKELREKLVELRGKESLRDAAKRIGISHSYLSIIEKGIDVRSNAPIKPSPDTLRLISNAYNYSYEDLMRLAGYIEGNDEENDQQKNIDPQLQKYLDEVKAWHFETPDSKEEKMKLLEDFFKMIKKR